MTAPRNPDDEPRDAHLLAALRHAPDHEVAPPAELSARIRAQARQAVDTRRPAPVVGPGLLERWFGWMSRPVAAGAFGTLLMAGFVGLMWRDGPPPEAMPGGDPPMATAPAPAAAPAPVAPTTAPTTAAAPPPTAAATAAAPEPQAPVAQAEVRPPRVDKARVETRTEAKAQAEVAASPVPSPAPSPTPVPAPPPPPRSAPPVADVAAPAVAAAPAPTVTVVPSAAPMPAPAPAMAPAKPSAMAPARAPAAAPAGAIGNAAPAEAAESTLDAQTARRDRASNAPMPAARLSGTALPDPLAAPLAALSSPGDAPWRERLQALRTTTQGRWARAEPMPADTGEAVTDASGRLLGRLRVEALRFTWQGTDGQAWAATLAPQAAASAASR